MEVETTDNPKRTEKNMTEKSENFTPETQQQRWVKYGANVALAVVIVLVLAVVLILIGQRTNKPIDMTANQAYSLKPQTLNILQNLDSKQPIRIVSLYTHPQGVTSATTDYAGVVSDLLDEYKHAGKNIDVEVIDPVANPAKVTDLIADVTTKYGGEVKRYKDYLDQMQTNFDLLRSFARSESAKLATVQFDQMKEEGVDGLFSQVSGTLADWPDRLDHAVKEVDTARKQKVPDYKGAADVVNREISRGSDVADQVVQQFTTVLADAKLSATLTPPQKLYMADSIPRFNGLKKQTDALVDQFKKLGALKLDEVTQKLNERDAILVMGPNDMRSLSYDQVWQADTDKRTYQNTAGEVKLKPKFAGEQQITSAILSLTAAKKPKVVFLRPSGAPMTSPGFPPFQPAGPFSKVAERLRQYNFEVLEKDMSGQYAMQAQMQGQQVEPEPSDDQVKDAVWIVLGTPQQQPNPQAPPPVSIAPKLAEHLKAGGAAMCLFLPQADSLTEALDPMGITIKTDQMAVHQAIKTNNPSTDIVEEAKKNPAIWVVNHFNDTIITKPVESLDTLLIQVCPVLTAPKTGYQTTSILPLPTEVPSWGEHDLQSIESGEGMTYKPSEGDLPPPLYAGAMSQGTNGSRLVAIGSLPMIVNQLAYMQDPDMMKRGIPAARFPGNSDVFCNSVFWLSHLEPLIAISPSAMDVSRIGDMGDGTLKFWRFGVLLIGLPGLILAAGVGVYLIRRD